VFWTKVSRNRDMRIPARKSNSHAAKYYTRRSRKIVASEAITWCRSSVADDTGPTFTQNISSRRRLRRWRTWQLRESKPSGTCRSPVSLRLTPSSLSAFRPRTKPGTKVAKTDRTRSENVSAFSVRLYIRLSYFWSEVDLAFSVDVHRRQPKVTGK